MESAWPEVGVRPWWHPEAEAVYLSEFFRTMGRRWYVVVLGVVATAALGLVAFQQVSPSYEARGSTLLLPPADSVEEGGNPFLQLSGLSQMVDVLVKYLDSDTVRQGLNPEPSSAEYEVARDAGTNGPIVAFTVEDSTEEGALALLTRLLDSVPGALDTLQASVDVPAEAEVTSMTLSASAEPTVVLTTTIRAVLVAVAGGLVVTAALVALVDAWARRRALRAQVRRDRSALGDGAGEPGSPSETDEEPVPAPPSSRERVSSRQSRPR